MKKLGVMMMVAIFAVSCASIKTTSNSEAPQGSESKSYECVGKVLTVTSKDIDRGVTEGQMSVKVVKVKVTSSQNSDVKPGDVIYCELIAKPNVKPVEGREYVFKSKYKHPTRAKGKYLLETNVLDLIL